MRGGRCPNHRCSSCLVSIKAPTTSVYRFSPEISSISQLPLHCLLLVQSSPTRILVRGPKDILRRVRIVLPNRSLKTRSKMHERALMLVHLECHLTITSTLGSPLPEPTDLGYSAVSGESDQYKDVYHADDENHVRILR